MYQDTTQPQLAFLATSTTVAYKEYRLNNAYDVNPVLGNTAMPGFAEWAAIYTQYIVTYAKIVCTFSLDQNSPPFYVGVVFRPVYNESNWGTWTEWMNLKGNPLPHKRMLLSNSGGNKSRVTLTVGCPIWKLFGMKQEYFGSGSFSNVVGSGPTSQLQGYIYALTPGGIALTSTYAIATDVKVYMYVKFYNKKTKQG